MTSAAVIAVAGWVLAIGNVGAMAWISRGGRGGWAFSLAWQAPWAVYSVATRQYGFILLSVGYGSVYFRHLFRHCSATDPSVWAWRFGPLHLVHVGRRRWLVRWRGRWA